MMTIRSTKKCCFQITTCIVIVTVFVLVKNGYKGSAFKRQQLNAEDQNQLQSQQPMNVFFLMTSPEEVKHLPVQLKNILYYRSSPVFLHMFVSSQVLEKIINTLLFSWEAERVLFKVYRLSSTEVPTSAFQLLNCFKKHLPRFASKGVYMNHHVLFRLDIKLWMKLSSTFSGDYVALKDASGCNNVECNDKPSLMYIALENDDLESKKEFQSKIIGDLPCHLIPYQANMEESGCSSRHSAGVEGILVVNRTDFYGDRFHDNQLHLSISESIMNVDSSPPKVWPHITTPSNDNIDYEKFLTSLKSLHNFKFHSMSYAGRHSKSSNKLTSGNTSHNCQRFLDIAHLKRRTHLFYHCGNQWLEQLEHVSQNETPVTTNDIQVTLMTALTPDRFSSLERMLSHWSGPAAILFYLSDSEACRKLPRLLGDSKIFKNKEIKDRTAIHIVYQRLSYNPLNYLRNVLLNNTFTSHVFYLDVDLLPNPGVYKSIVKHLTELADVKENNTKLFMVPAFQSFISLESNYPKDKLDFLKHLKDETVTGYKQKIGWALGHRPTNYSKWILADKPYHAKFQDAFEPYVIVPRHIKASFNEDLLERMGDKIAYTRLIHGMGYDYYVLPSDYAIHLPHPISLGSLNYFTEPHLFKCGSVLFEEYRRKLHAMFPRRKF